MTTQMDKELRAITEEDMQLAAMAARHYAMPLGYWQSEPNIKPQDKDGESTLKLAEKFAAHREQATASLHERIKFLEECCAENSKFQNKILEIGCDVGDFRRGETVCLNKAIHAIENQLAAKQAQIDSLVENAASQTQTHVALIKQLAAKQAQVDELLEWLQLCKPYVEAHTEASHLTDGFNRKQNSYDVFLDNLNSVLSNNNVVCAKTAQTTHQKESNDD